MKFTDACRQLIAKDKLEKVVELMLDCLKTKSSDLYNTMIIQSSRLNGNNNNVRMGILDYKDAKRTRAQITIAVNHTLDEIDKEGIDCPDIELPEKEEDGSTRRTVFQREDEKKKILFLSANPASDLRIDKEAKAIKSNILKSEVRDNIEFEIELAVTPDDIMETILRYKPNIVHFSGHGEKDGIIVEDDHGAPMIIPLNALGNLFKIFAKDVDINLECVVLNACYSEEQAFKIAEHITHVIGMNKKIKDTSSIRFSTGFYKSLGQGKPYDYAFEMGKVAIELYAEEGEETPIHLKKSF